VHVLGYTWAGVRTSDLNSSSRFFSDILGLRRVHDGKGLVQFELPSGQLFEVFGSESRYYQFHNCPVLGFRSRMCVLKAGNGIKGNRVHD
jgi:catechol 2,3-dioxygenase-like lactoylglutathione lyase family enzyme